MFSLLVLRRGNAECVLMWCPPMRSRWTPPGEMFPTYAPNSYFPSRLPHNKTELLAMVGKKQARQFHQALYSINQKSSDLKKWEEIGQAPKLGTAYKWEYCAISRLISANSVNMVSYRSLHDISHCTTQGGEVYLQIRASLRRQGWDPSVRWAVHWFWHDQKYTGTRCVWKYQIVKLSPFCGMHTICLTVLFTHHLSGVRDVRSWLQVPSPQQCFHIPLGIPGDSLSISITPT